MFDLRRLKMMKTTAIHISDAIYTACPQFTLATIECSVQNSQNDSELWMEITDFCTTFRNHTKIEEINKHPIISATRQAYKKMGKDPNRYRPSAEALCRRIVKGMELYRINTLVDLINLVSLKTGYSIGGFDADKISGDVCLGIGKADEPFEGIGRGLLNIERLPVYRDERGGVGTPTSDEERTKLALSSTHLLMLINGYSGKDGLREAVHFSMDLLKKYANAKDMEVRYI